MKNNFSKLTALDIEELKNKGLADKIKKGGKRTGAGRPKKNSEEQTIMKLGEQKILSTILERKLDRNSGERNWVEKQIKETTAIFCGYRVLKNGEFDWETNRVTKCFKVAMFALNLKTLVYVSLHSV